ncbi:MAG: hypothetical protein ACRDRO_14255 [Pseudonocardiaceae bacterium]
MEDTGCPLCDAKQFTCRCWELGAAKYTAGADSTSYDVNAVCPGGRLTSEGAEPMQNPMLDLFRSLKDIELADGTWPASDTVQVVGEWFTANGIDPEQPYATVAQRFGINTEE